MTNDLIAPIYARHAAALEMFAGTNGRITSDAILLNLALALQELAAAIRPTDTDELVRLRTDLADAIAERDAAQQDIIAVEAWLEQHDAARFATVAAGATTLAQAIADYHTVLRIEIDRLNAELRTLRIEIVNALAYHDGATGNSNGVTERAAAIEDRDNSQETIAQVEAWLEQHDAARFATVAAGATTLAQAIADYHTVLRIEIDRLNAELRTLRSYAIAPKTDLPQQQPPAIAAAVQAAALSAQSAQSADPIPDAADDDLSDWIIGLDAKRHTWRTIPKPVRWRLITATLRSIWKDGRLPSMADFDAAKPEWMPIATSVALSYGDGKWTTVCGKAAQP